MSVYWSVRRILFFITLGGLRAASPNPSPDILSEAAQLFNAQKLPDAIKQLDDYTRSNPTAANVPAALLLKGQCEAHSKGATQAQAEKTWGWLIQKYPNSDEAVRAYQELAGYYSSQSRPELAEKTREDMIRLYPKHPLVIEGLGVQAGDLSAKGQYKEALAIYEKISTGLTPAQQKEMELCKAAVQGATNPQALLAAAQQAFVDNPDDATELYEAYLKSPAATALSEARTRLGFCYYRSHDPAKTDRAEKLWQEVILRGPPTDEWVIESHWYMIQLLAGPKHQWQKAIPELDAILRDAKPGTFRHEQALFTKGWLYWANQQWDDAQKAFTLLVQLYPAKQNHEPIQSYLKDCQAKKSS